MQCNAALKSFKTSYESVRPERVEGRFLSVKNLTPLFDKLLTKYPNLNFDISWFDPFFEFRFPHHGGITVDNIQLEIRLGIEPWHVLGEELSSNGTARFVDSSLERLQVKMARLPIF